MEGTEEGQPSQDPSLQLSRESQPDPAGLWPVSLLKQLMDRGGGKQGTEWDVHRMEADPAGGEWGVVEGFQKT